MMAQTPASIQQASWGPSGWLTQFCSSKKWRQTLLAEVTSRRTRGSMLVQGRCAPGVTAWAQVFVLQVSSW